MGALSYADDITLSSPSLQGLNCMLSICNEFAHDNFLVFNTKKTVCIKYGESIKQCECAFIDGVKLTWQQDVRHLGNYFNTYLDSSIDSNKKCSYFIGYFNKLYSNFMHVQPDTLSNLFKSYCCSYYGSFLWKYNSNGFLRCCTQWNKAVRCMYNLPYNAHRWILGPLIGQPHISQQLHIRDIKFIYRMLDCPNSIVKQCVNMASRTADSLIGYKLAYYRYKYGFDLMECNQKKALIVLNLPCYQMRNVFILILYIHYV